MASVDPKTPLLERTPQTSTKTRPSSLGWGYMASLSNQSGSPLIDIDYKFIRSNISKYENLNCGLIIDYCYDRARCKAYFLTESHVLEYEIKGLASRVVCEITDENYDRIFLDPNHNFLLCISKNNLLTIKISTEESESKEIPDFSYWKVSYSAKLNLFIYHDKKDKRTIKTLDPFTLEKSIVLELGLSVKKLSVNETGKIMAVSFGRFVSIYELRDRESFNLINSIQSQDGFVGHIKISPTGKFLVTSVSGKNPSLWITKNRQFVRKFYNYQVLFFSENYIFLSTKNLQVSITGLGDLEEVVNINSTKSIKGVLASEERNVLIIVSDYGVQVGKMHTSGVKRVHKFNNEIHYMGQFSDLKVFYGTKDKVVIENFNNKNSQKLEISSLFNAQKIIKEDIKMNLNTKLGILFISYCKELVLFDVSEEKILKSLSFEDKIISLGHGEKYSLVVGFQNNTIRLFEDVVKQAHLEYRVKLTFKPNIIKALSTGTSELIVLGAIRRHIVCVVDPEPSPPKMDIIHTTSNLTCVRVDKKTNYLFLGEKNGCVEVWKLWNVEERQKLCILNASSTWITDIMIPKGSKNFLTYSADGNIKIYRKTDFEYISELRIFKGEKDFFQGNLLKSVGDCLYISYERSVYSIPNPIATRYLVGPSAEKEEYFRYLQAIMKRENPVYDPRMDSFCIFPKRINTLHFFVTFGMTEHLKKALAAGTSFVISKQNQTPLTIAIKNKNSECINAIIKYLKKKCKNKLIQLGLDHDQIVELNEVAPAYLTDFYEIALIKDTSGFLPDTCSDQVYLPVISASDDNRVVNLSNFTEPENFKADGLAIEFKNSAISLNLESGSSDSIEFLKSINNSPIEEIFTTNYIGTLLDYKWQNLKWVLFGQGFLYVIYLVILSVYTGFMRGSDSLMIPLFIVNFFLLAYEGFQIYVLRSSYWKDKWNWIDFFRSVTFIVYAMIVWIDTNEKHYNWLLIEIVVLSWIRGITYFRLFSNTRYMVNLISEVFKDMISFLILLFYSVIAFSFIFMSLQEDGYDKETFSDLFINSYLLGLGEFSTDGFGTIQWVVFFLASLVNTLIMLNLLISIMGDTFQKVQENNLLADRKELIDMILEAETLLVWRRDRKNYKYLQVCNEKNFYSTSSNWIGRIKTIKKKIASSQKTVIENMQSNERRIQEVVESYVQEYTEKLERNLMEFMEHRLNRAESGSHSTPQMRLLQTAKNEELSEEEVLDESEDESREKSSIENSEEEKLIDVYSDIFAEKIGSILAMGTVNSEVSLEPSPRDLS